MARSSGRFICFAIERTRPPHTDVQESTEPARAFPIAKHCCRRHQRPLLRFHLSCFARDTTILHVLVIFFGLKTRPFEPNYCIQKKKCILPPIQRVFEICSSSDPFRTVDGGGDGGGRHLARTTPICDGRRTTGVRRSRSAAEQCFKAALCRTSRAAAAAAVFLRRRRCQIHSPLERA